MYMCKNDGMRINGRFANDITVSQRWMQKVIHDVESESESINLACKGCNHVYISKS